jgi:ATP-dependent helicase/nuclease subunit B
MRIRREWLDWDKPCLPQAAAWLIERAIGQSSAASRWCDMQSITCVLPGSRAGRLLLGTLMRECRARHLQLVPPRIHTPGSLVASLIADQPVASDVEMELAWAAALRRIDRESIKPLLPFAPADDDAIAWQSLAKTIARLHDDLAGGCREFSDVADLAERLELFGEGDRWRALEHVYDLYRRTLHAIGLRDRHEAIAGVLSRSPLAQFNISPLRELALVAVPELNAIQRRFIAALGERAVALIHAPHEMADRFDDLGCVMAEQWSDATIAIEPARIISADRPGDQAQAALRTIGGFNGVYSAGEITIGLGDPALGPSLGHAADWGGVKVRDAEGVALRATPPCRALQIIGDYLSDPRFAAFAALLRHTDIEQWVWNQARDAHLGVAEWLTLLDRYFQEYLDERFTGQWLGDDENARRLKAVYGAIARLVAPLWPDHRAIRPMHEWAQPILDVLAALYGEVDQGPHLPGNALRHLACRQIRDALAQLSAASAELQPQVTSADAIALLLEHNGDEALPQPDEESAIEMLGWLELHLDPAPALIITGFNEGQIPKSASSDPFLPDSLRQRLGLPCNATRYARDGYMLEAMLHSRERLTLIAGRRSDRGEALTPSRLLLACHSAELVQRVKMLCDGQAAASNAMPIGMAGLAVKTSRFVVPELPQPQIPPRSMRITDFSAYLRCPYRFALSRLLQLEALDDSVHELDPLQFGSLAHDILCAFGQDQDINGCDDPDQIERFLLATARQLVPRRFGSSAGPAVRVQIARLELRLAAFASLQANLCREGWRIKFCELPFKEGEVALDVPGQDAMPLRGKIDRIDFNERSGVWRIIDYKTSESAKSPHKTHTGREQCDGLAPEDWKDLQLPLYHYLAANSKHSVQGETQLAYICLPRQLDGVALKAAQWTAEHLSQALDVARDVVRMIRAGAFQLNRDFAGFDDFARICQTAAYLDDQPLEVEA